jgi:hypothetical protein
LPRQRTKPEVYLASVVSLLPRQQQVERLNPLSDISDEELEQLQQLLLGLRAKTVKQLERHDANGADTVAPPLSLFAEKQNKT